MRGLSFLLLKDKYTLCVIRSSVNLLFDTKYQVAGLKDGEVRTIHVSAALIEGVNTFELTAKGKPGTSAAVTIPVVPVEDVTAAGTGVNGTGMEFHFFIPIVSE